MAELDKDVQHLYKVIDKLDTAIEKLSDVSTDIKSILAVHEQRLDQTAVPQAQSFEVQIQLSSKKNCEKLQNVPILVSHTCGDSG